LQLGAIVAHIITRDAGMAVVGLSNLNAITLDDVGAAALQDGMRRDDLDLILRALGELSH
jgi:hypothetical protein